MGAPPNWRTVVVRDFDHGPTHCAVLDENADLDVPISLRDWLDMQHWPRTGCGLYSALKALCGRPVSTRSQGVILEGPETAVGCEECQQVPLSYPMLEGIA